MQLVERFRAEGHDGRVVEILKWGPSAIYSDDGWRNGQTPAIYATVEGWRCDPTEDGGYTIMPSGVSVRRVG
jgi:hypothetical protein